MNLLDALKEVDKGHKVTCTAWKRFPNYIFKTEESKELRYYNGVQNKIEPVEVSVLIDWMMLDKAEQHDWEILE